MRAYDTSPEAHEVQLAIWRRMGAEGRHALVIRLSEELRELSRSGIRLRHPGYTEAEVELALRRLTWGDALFRQVYPEHATLSP
jgi:hypothetical protein